MIEFGIRKIYGTLTENVFNATTVALGDTTVDLGLLDGQESVDLAIVLRDAADELDPQD